MRMLPLMAVVAIALAGCDQSSSTPTRTPMVEPPAKVEIGGPQGGVHVNDPAGGTKVDIGGPQGGVHVDTPESKVDVP
jgi:hypothetical protein